MRKTAYACVLLIIPVLTGCTVLSPEKIVLAGTWQAAGGPYLLPTSLVFDELGNLQQTITTPTSATVVTDDLLNTSTSVTGDQVTFRYDIPLVGSQSFSGTLSPDQTTITGQMTLTAHIFLTTITTNEGTVTLTKTPAGS